MRKRYPRVCGSGWVRECRGSTEPVCDTCDACGSSDSTSSAWHPARPGRPCRTFVGMGTTGLIFGGLVAAWLAYLVPWYLSHRAQTPMDVEHTLNFTEDAKLIHLRDDAEALDLSLIHISEP